jgi:hypothetical protein
MEDLRSEGTQPSSSAWQEGRQRREDGYQQKGQAQCEEERKDAARGFGDTYPRDAALMNINVPTGGVTPPIRQHMTMIVPNCRGS